jgi:hypothetical protein
MTKTFQGYEINEKDIDTALRYLIYEKKQKNPTRKDAIALLNEKNAISHITAHKVVEDEQSGKIEPVKLQKD